MFDANGAGGGVSVSSSLSSGLFLAGHLTVAVRQARGLQNRQLLGKSDPFVKVKVGPSAAHSTEVVKDSTEPVFNQEFEFPVYEAMSGRIQVEVMLLDAGR